MDVKNSNYLNHEMTEVIEGREKFIYFNIFRANFHAK